jgi:multidrug efflux pump subunit AcrB
LYSITNRPVAVLSWSTAILVAGLWAATKVPVEWVPNVELPEVSVMAVWPEGSPRQVERYVTTPIERAVQIVPGAEHVSSYSQEGVSTVTVQVSKDTNLGTFVAQVNEQLQIVRGVLPDRVFPRLTKQVPEELRDQLGFMTVQLIGPQEADVLRAYAEREIKPRLSSLPGLGEIRVEGGTEREVRVELDPDRMASFGVGPMDVRFAILEANRDLTFGRLDESGRSMLVYSPPESRVEALSELPIRSRIGAAPIVVGDVAKVSHEDAPLRSVSRIDGQPVVTITIDRARGSNMLDVAAGVRGRVGELGEWLPEGARLVVAVDRSESVRAQFDSLIVQGSIGLLLVVLVLLFMLKSLRAVLVVVFSVSVAVAVAYLMFLPLGLTLNMITVAGVVLVFGMLVDNSVVVVEELMLRKPRGRRDKGGGDNRGFVLEGLASVWPPLAGGTLTTIVVLIPLVYLSGELRQLFVPFGMLICVSLLASLLAAGTIVPVAADFLPPLDVTKSRAGRWMRRVVAVPYRWVSRFPRLALLFLVLLIGLPLWKVPTVISTPDEGTRARPIERLVTLYNDVQQRDAVIAAREFLEPKLGGVLRPFFRGTTFGTPWQFGRGEEVYVGLSFPPGNPVERADSLIRPFEAIALESPSVEQTIVRVTDQSASLRVSFLDGWLQQAEPYIMRERLIKRATLIGGIGVSVGGLVQDGYYSGSGGSMSGLRLVAYGANYEDLEVLSDRFADFVKRRSRRVRDVRTSSGRYSYASSEREVVRIDWRADQEVRSGATAADLSNLLRPVFSTQTPSFFFADEDHELLPGRIVVTNANSTQLGRLISRPLTLDDSTQVRLASYAAPTMVTRPSAIEREDQQYKRYIEVDYIGPYQLANTFIEDALASFAVPSGYRLQLDRFSFFTEDTRRSLLWMILGTIVLVFLITAIVFESWKLPFLVLLSVPTALVGVALAFNWTGATFSQGGFIGVILLVGVAANDSILLGHRYAESRKRFPQRNPVSLVRLAVRQRLRPMWATTLTSVAAMLPLIILAADSDFWLALALVVTGGLVSSTLLAPLATVALVATREGRRGRMKDEG